MKNARNGKGFSMDSILSAVKHLLESFGFAFLVVVGCIIWVCFYNCGWFGFSEWPFLIQVLSAYGLSAILYHPLKHIAQKIKDNNETRLALSQERKKHERITNKLKALDFDQLLMLHHSLQMNSRFYQYDDGTFHDRGYPLKVTVSSPSVQAMLESGVIEREEHSHGFKFSRDVWEVASANRTWIRQRLEDSAPR